MYKIVTTEEERTLFDDIWKDAWIEKGYELEYSSNPLAQVLVESNNNCIGTIEFKKLTDSETVKVFDFKRFPQVDIQFDNVIEVDKLSVKKEFRSREALTTIFSTLVHFADDFDIPGYVALIEPRLFLTLKKKYRRDVTKLAEAFHYKGDDVVPIFFDTKNLLETKDDISWLLHRHEEKTVQPKAVLKT